MWKCAGSLKSPSKAHGFRTAFSDEKETLKKYNIPALKEKTPYYNFMIKQCC